MKGLILNQQQQQEENMSNLTSASSVSSGNKNENSTAINYSTSQQWLPHPPPSQSQPPLKKKRNQPGNPDPDAEVVALSPKTLMATNRFVCEICNKGFQRDQNLQLHRRGHNLPWKLKQRAKNEVVKKKVYICPETSCVHHDPLRALGDLTGIKKHFSRKHGEKKWKCDKCSKKYAVQSDWKAHSKTCGTKEYRCDCGTLFSRRDSFITHRAFCDALAEESARAITPNPLLISPEQSCAAASTTGNAINLRQIAQPIGGHQDMHAFSLKRETQSFGTLRPELPPWLKYGPAGPPNQQTLVDYHHLSSSSSSVFDHHHQDLSSSNVERSLGPTLTPPPPPSPHMSATALLQKAAQMGATMSSKSNTNPGLTIRPHQQPHVTANHNTNTASFGLNLGSRDQELAASDSGPFVHDLQQSATGVSGVFLQEMMNSLSSTSGFEGTVSTDAFMSEVLKKGSNFGDDSLSKATTNGNNGEGLTRDFLGLRAFSHSDILSMAAGFSNYVHSASHEHQPQHHQKTWQG